MDRVLKEIDLDECLLQDRNVTWRLIREEAVLSGRYSGKLAKLAIEVRLIAVAGLIGEVGPRRRWLSAKLT
jgi:hypothetical protein